MMSSGCKVVLLFSHTLTSDQMEELNRRWNVSKVIHLPQELQRLWSEIPPSLESLSDYLRPIFDWFEHVANPGDISLIQGDFGAVYLMVRKALDLGLVPLYATTRREVHEVSMPDGSVRQERVFRHERFRVYGR